MPRCLVVQHVAAEGPAGLSRLLGRRQVAVETCRIFAGEDLPALLPGLDGLAGLVVMGGPMSATSDDGFPTRQAELALLRLAVAAGVPTLGICLGAQLLAEACGGRVVPGGAGPEIGWGPVRLSASAAGDALFAGLGPDLEVLHWHGDTFELPPGADLLASSERYRAQAFRAGPRAWGLQFHLEVDEEAAEGMIRAFPGDAALAPGGAPSIVAGARRAGPGAPAGPAGGSGPPCTVLGRFADLVANG